MEEQTAAAQQMAGIAKKVAETVETSEPHQETSSAVHKKLKNSPGVSNDAASVKKSEAKEIEPASKR